MTLAKLLAVMVTIGASVMPLAARANDPAPVAAAPAGTDAAAPSCPPQPEPWKPPQDPGVLDSRGGPGTANTAASVYDVPGGGEIDCLAPMAPVLIVQCGMPVNWCEISRPTAGWVWGVALDR